MESGNSALCVGELFAGIGGFRVGLEGLGTKENPGADGYEVVFSNQWEPGERSQIASKVYVDKFGADGHTNQDIFEIVRNKEKFDAILDMKLDMLVGGFPCQDYSVARLAHQANGLSGEKGVLWWAIYDFLRLSREAGQPLKYVFLENVDNLIAAGRGCKGRDFAVILSCFASLGYAVEWRVVHSADHGWPQQRRRTFILAYHQSTNIGMKLSQSASKEWLQSSGVIAATYPVEDIAAKSLSTFGLGADPVAAQASYLPTKNGKSAFLRGGVFANGVVVTTPVKPIKSITLEAAQSGVHTLGDVVDKTLIAPEELYISDERLPGWLKAKGGRKVQKVNAAGQAWTYSEGAMSFPERLDRASRTIITSEGGITPLRTKHAVKDNLGRLRRLTPDELDELSGFPRGWTNAAGATANQRAKLVGNALITGVVMQIGKALKTLIH